MASNSVSVVSAQEAASSYVEPKPAAASEMWNYVDSFDLDPVTTTTVGDEVKQHLNMKSLRRFLNKSRCLNSKHCLRLLVISKLPRYPNDCYTEEEVASLLYRFGFEYEVDTIYVIAQTGMAFALMPSTEALKNAVRVAWNGIPFKGRKLCLRAVNNRITMTPLGFYKSVMKLMHFEVNDDDYGSRTVFFYDISPGEVEELREVLLKNFSVLNFLPLLNKLFVEFEWSDDVDLLGLSYSQYRGQTYSMLRLKEPETLNSSYDPSDLPLETFPPFWVTMKTAPYIFPTASPWFNIPSYTTTTEILNTNLEEPRFFGVMLTGLPESAYTHQEVVDMLWHHAPEEDYHSLNSNLIVLPLQRRAFVFFSNQYLALQFVQWNHYGSFVFKEVTVGVHPLSEMTHPGPSDV